MLLHVAEDQGDGLNQPALASSTQSTCENTENSAKFTRDCIVMVHIAVNWQKGVDDPKDPS